MKHDQSKIISFVSFDALVLIWAIADFSSPTAM